MKQEIIENSKILVIDDQPSNLSILFEYLDALNADVMLIQNPREAVNLAEIKMPHIILLDILMPEMDGYEVCRKLKENKKTADIPVIFMTCVTETEDIVKGFEIGAVDYITKPARKEEVVARISTHLTIRRTEEDLKRYRNHLEEMVEKRTNELKKIIEILKCLNQEQDELCILKNILNLLKEFTGFEAIGIRIKDGQDYPYFATAGFSEDFIKAENSLLIRDKDGKILMDSNNRPCLECICGRVLMEDIEDKPFFTERGSFWTNSITELLSSIGEDWKNKLSPGHCITAGYESIALIPLRADEEIVGLLQINDTCRNRFTPETIKFFEGISSCIGIALKRWKMEEEKNKLEVQLRQAQKMEAIGTLAGGIAHDFNNILGIIMGYTELSIPEVPEGSEIHKFLSQIMIAEERAKKLVKQILAFSRRSEEKKKLLKLSPLLKEAINLLRASLPSTIEIKKDIEEDRNLVMADATQIHQILMNLCTNAAHAMKENGGVLTIKLNNINITPEELHLYHNINPGNYMKITVSDTGHGIKSEFIEKIFEPYFTTKRVEEGTGLGLSVVHGIVKSYGGDIQVYSEAGKGTTFHILLPGIKDDTIIVAEELKPLQTGTGRILIVDDEKNIVEMLGLVLTRLGYNVTGKTSSLEALKAFRDDPSFFDLVITDQTMPYMTGKELAKELIAIKPDIPVILTTGYSNPDDFDSARYAGVREFLLKPVNMKEIAEVVNRVLMKNEKR